MSINEYILEKRLTENHAYFLFDGHFQQRAVTWHVHLSTCQSQAPEKLKHNRQFIDISEMPDDGHLLARVCLNIERIHSADITKTIIMLKQYKRLSLGRHEYGEPV